jgi:hypothetical protein
VSRGFIPCGWFLSIKRSCSDLQRFWLIVKGKDKEEDRIANKCCADQQQFARSLRLRGLIVILYIVQKSLPRFESSFCRHEDFGATTMQDLSFLGAIMITVSIAVGWYLLGLCWNVLEGYTGRSRRSGLNESLLE